MRHFLKLSLLLALLAAGPERARGFALNGPYKTWQLATLGYQLVGDIGGPQNVSEAYRWNVPVVTYAFDQSFIFFFGSNGMAAVDSAMSYINAVTNANEIVLDDFPLQTRQRNFLAHDAGLLDVKSFAMSAVLGELGLAAPERWVWVIRERFPAGAFTNYLVNKYNFDPYSWQPSSYVNGTLYPYTIQDPVLNDPLNAAYADAVETYPNVGLSLAVAGGVEGKSSLGTGDFFTGLTRDDVGALRFLLNTNLVFVETLIPGVTGYTNTNNVIAGWIPWLGGSNTAASYSNSYWYSNLVASQTNVGTTNATNFYVATGLRPGVGKIQMQNVTPQFDSLIGSNFTAFTNVYYETVLITNKLLQQKMQRVITAPDILFTAEDLPINSFGTLPVLIQRTAATTWINNDGMNGSTVTGGPGLVAGPIRISYNSRLLYYFVSLPTILEEDLVTGGTWATFDQSTNAPILYPQYMQLSLEDIMRMARVGPYAP